MDFACVCLLFRPSLFVFILLYLFLDFVCFSFLIFVGLFFFFFRLWTGKLAPEKQRQRLGRRRVRDSKARLEDSTV